MGVHVTFSRGHILEKGPSEIGQECAPNPLTWQNPASIYRIQPLRGMPGRSLCVAPLQEELWESMWPFSEGHILEKGPPPRSAKNVLQTLYLMTKFNVAKSSLDF